MSEKYGFKLIITGDAAVGKTSLIRRYCDNKFDQDQTPSIGADFTLKAINLPKTEVILTIWDVGGQPLFDQIRNYYYTGSDAGVLVFDVTDENSLTSIRNKWLPEMLGVGDIPIAIMANKTDLEDQRVISSEICEQIKQEFGYELFETSAKTGNGVKKAFEYIAQQCIIPKNK